MVRSVSPMEIPHRAGTVLMAAGVLMLFAGSLANIILVPVTIPGSAAGVRALRRWNGIGGTDAPLWAGAALVCAVIPALFALVSGVLVWAAWAWTTVGLSAAGWVAARQHAARLHRQWALERRYRTDPTAPHPESRRRPANEA